MICGAMRRDSMWLSSLVICSYVTRAHSHANPSPPPTPTPTPTPTPQPPPPPSPEHTPARARVRREEEYEKSKAGGKWKDVVVPESPAAVYKMYTPVRRSHDKEEDYEKLRKNKMIQAFLARQRQKRRKEAKEAAERARAQAMEAARKRAEKKKKRMELRVAVAADVSVAQFSIERGVEVTPHSTGSTKGRRRFSKLRDDVRLGSQQARGRAGVVLARTSPKASYTAEIKTKKMIKEEGGEEKSRDVATRDSSKKKTVDKKRPTPMKQTTKRSAPRQEPTQAITAITSWEATTTKKKVEETGGWTVGGGSREEKTKQKQIQREDSGFDLVFRYEQRNRINHDLEHRAAQ